MLRILPERVFLVKLKVRRIEMKRRRERGSTVGGEGSEEEEEMKLAELFAAVVLRAVRAVCLLLN